MMTAHRIAVIIAFVITMVTGFGLIYAMILSWSPQALLAIFVLGCVFIVITVSIIGTVEADYAKKSDWLNTLGLRETAQIRYPEQNV